MPDQFNFRHNSTRTIIINGKNWIGFHEISSFSFHYPLSRAPIALTEKSIQIFLLQDFWSRLYLYRQCMWKSVFQACTLIYNIICVCFSFDFVTIARRIFVYITHSDFYYKMKRKTHTICCSAPCYTYTISNIYLCARVCV